MEVETQGRTVRFWATKVEWGEGKIGHLAVVITALFSPEKNLVFLKLPGKCQPDPSPASQKALSCLLAEKASKMPFIWENLTHSLMNHGNLNHEALPQRSHRLQSLISEHAPSHPSAKANSSVTQAPGFWPLPSLKKWVFGCSILLYCSQLLCFRPRLKNCCCLQALWQFNKHTDFWTGGSYLTPSLAITEPNYAPLNFPSVS